MLDNGGCSWEVVFELGLAFMGHTDAAEESVFGICKSKESFNAVQRCVEVGKDLTAAANAAIECWLFVSRRLGVVKDIRLLIARLAWEPWLWSK